MEALKKKLPLVLSLAILLLIFKVWFLPGIITGGDFWPGFASMYGNFPLFPYAWHWGQGVGMGGSTGGLLWFITASVILTTIFGTLLHLPVELAERFSFFYPFLIIGFFSSAFVFRKLFPENKFWVLSPLIFILNTYILMIIGGGQIFIMLSYSLVPLVIYSFTKIFNEKLKLKSSIIAGLILAIQIMLDLRVAYITLAAVGLYWLLMIAQHKNIKYIFNSVLYVFIIPGMLSLLMHAFWMIPTLINRENPLQTMGSAYTSIDAVKFFSFSKLEDAISLLHPNWPENIFGKVGFMKPEFLFLPVLAFLSLLFVTSSKIPSKGLGTGKNQKSKFQFKTQNFQDNLAIEQFSNRTIIFFVFLGLFGAFMAKGANDPFGEVYLWIFGHIPGFIMFRDPTKWYTLVAVSYSVLIPFSIWKIYEWLKSRSKFSIFPSRFLGTSNFQFSIKKIFNLQRLFLILTALYLLLLIRPALFGQLKGTLSRHSIPQDYTKLEKFISTQNNFSRTLWIPTVQRYEFYINLHPAIPANDFFKVNTLKEDIDLLNKRETLKVLQESSVKYVIIPYDSEGEIFLTDRKYDERIYSATIKDIQKIKWLKAIDCTIVKLSNCSGDPFGNIKVFEVPNSKDHFWSTRESLILIYKYINPTKYEVNVQNAKRGDVLIFSESYDPRWVSVVDGQKVNSIPYRKRLNSFVLKKDGDYQMEIYYTPQSLMDRSLIISIVALFGSITFLLFAKGKQK